MLEVLRHRGFRRLFTAQVVALVGTGLLTVALGLLAFDIAGADAGAVLGTALAIKMVAYVGVAPVISAVTDRVPRRVLLVSADVVRAVVALALPFVSEVWQIYLLIFVLQAASATFTPAFQAVIPSVLEDEEDYTRGLSLSRLAYDLESLLSPVLAAALLTVISYNLLFVGTTAGFVVSAAMVVGTQLPRRVPVDRSVPLTRRITGGARIMAADPVLRGLLAMNLAVGAATALVVVNTVVYVRELLAGPPSAVAVALGFYGAGSMVVAISMPRLLAVMPDRRLMLTGCTVLPIGLAMAAVLAAIEPAPAFGWVLLAVAWLLLGAGASMINTPAARLLRAQSNASTRPAVFTAQFSLSHACFLLTYPVAGWVGAVVGQFAAAVALAVLATLAGITAARVWPKTLPAVPQAQTVESR
ncbi:MFS transporter [Nocardia neocaledoniensis NBRC 108232]|uniref:MFS transporter n=1 Tax=Nocardia neocaledoniensis TaxID=236511 RepID=A0A317N1H6_9NOCA|nr:MFS transporter [Nocardia neocaledoniensis]PWV67791.1 MFS transporter [Nocardia neocaledoniensis]GEM30989.1 MFS transporter [Nocardia neocaledoniensis NBRC 108232]